MIKLSIRLRMEVIERSKNIIFNKFFFKINSFWFYFEYIPNKLLSFASFNLIFLYNFESCNFEKYFAVLRNCLLILPT